MKNLDENYFIKENGIIAAQLYKSEFIGIAAYTVPDRILVKVNQKYLETLEFPYNQKRNSLGRSIEEIDTRWKDKIAQKYWQEAINSQTVVTITEYENTSYNGNITYWDTVLTPIIEAGQVKYIYCNTVEVTDRVLYRKRIEQENEKLKTQVEQLKQVCENVIDALLIINKDGTYDYINERAKKMTWMSENKTGDCLVHSIYYAENGKELAKDEMPCSRALRGEIIENVVIRFERNNFTEYYNFNGHPIYNNNGEITSAILCIRDITEKYKIEQEVKKKNHQLEAIFETMSDVLLVTDKNGNIISKNSEAQKTSYQVFEFENIEDDFEKIDYLDENNNPIPLEEMPHNRVLRGEKVNNFKFTVKHSDKEVFIDANASPVFDEKGNIDLVVICCRDITDLREREREIINQNNQLHYSNIKLNIALESVGAGIWHYDLIKNEQTWSSKMYEFYGIDLSVIMSANLKEHPIIIKERERLEGILENAYRSNLEFISSEFCINNINGGMVWLKSTGKIIYDEVGNPKEVIGINLEITEEKNIEKKLLSIEREKYEALKASMKLKDEFLYLITHEFKTPLSVISSALQTMDLVCKNKMPEKADKYIITIKQNINRQIRLVNNLLDITRINSGNIKVNYEIHDIVYLTKSIVKSIQPIAHQKGVLINFSSMIDRKDISVDEEKFERILLNLLSNALKFTPSNKSINVKIYIRKHKNKSMVCICIQDEGIGIPKDKQSYIFERFGQVNTSLSRQAEGTGIGLHLVKMFVNILGGHITLESEEGKGSTFAVMIPAIIVKNLEENLINDKLLIQGESRLTKTAAIELSDIYL